MADSFALMHLVLEELNIRVAELSLPVCTVADFPDLGLRKFLFGEDTPFHEVLPPSGQPQGERTRVYLIRDRYLCRYFFRADADMPGRCWLAGPYLTKEPVLRDLTTIGRKTGLPMAGRDFLQTYYKMLPKIRDQNVLEALFRSHFVLHCGQEGFELVAWEMEADGPLPQSGSCPEPSADLKDFLDRNYLLEQKMTECIAQGNAVGAISVYSKLQLNGLEARTDNTLRDGKNSMIVLNTLCRAAAYRGGSDTSDLDRWSREFAVQIENAADLREVRPLSMRMLKKYCELVRSAERVQYSPIVRRAVDFISGSLDSDLSLKEMAARVGVSPSYFSALFKKETGKALTEYVKEKRLSFAALLLVRTDLPVSAVAAECGIPDSNYFTRVFKAWAGVPPMQYRSDRKRNIPETV